MDGYLRVSQLLAVNFSTVINIEYDGKWH